MSRTRTTYSRTPALRAKKMRIRPHDYSRGSSTTESYLQRRLIDNLAVMNTALLRADTGRSEGRHDFWHAYTLLQHELRVAERISYSCLATPLIRALNAIKMEDS